MSIIDGGDICGGDDDDDDVLCVDMEQVTSDVLGMMMIAQDKETGRGMSDDELRDQVMTLMVGGHEVSAATFVTITSSGTGIDSGIGSGSGSGNTAVSRMRNEKYAIQRLFMSESPKTYATPLHEW